MNWIVVADNSAELLQDAGHILCKRKMRVTGFRSGQALLEFLKDNQPDLILLGSVLWEIGGFEAITALKNAHKTGKEIPVLLMAGRAEQDMEARARAMGAAGVVRKPLVASELMANVLNILASNPQPGVQENAPICNTLEEVANTLEERNESTTGCGWAARRSATSIAICSVIWNAITASRSRFCLRWRFQNRSTRASGWKS